MRPAAVLLLTLLVGLGIGSASALWAAGLWPGTSPAAFSDVDVDGWRSDWSIGAPAANPYLRARVARHGLLALVKGEAAYLTRTVDDAGRPLTDRCVYRLNGGRQPAAWWSVTLYDAESRLPMNRDAALSVDATETADADAWSALIAPERPGAGARWLSSRNAGRFDLTLRLYRATPAALADPEHTIRAPTVQRLSCRGAPA